MKKILLINISFSVLLLASSCGKVLKDAEEYLPKTDMVGAEILNDGSVQLSGRLDSEGASPLLHAGFIATTDSIPKLPHGQINLGSGSFSYNIQDLNPDSTYYFRTFAANDHGYSYGKTIFKLSNITAPHVTPTCTLAMGYIKVSNAQSASTFHTVSGVEYKTDTWDITAGSGTGTVRFKFASYPTTGIYTTLANGVSATGKNVHVSFSGPQSGTLNEGSSVFVNRISQGVYDITICNAPWLYNGSFTYYFNARCKSPM